MQKKLQPGIAAHQRLPQNEMITQSGFQLRKIRIVQQRSPAEFRKGLQAAVFVIGNLACGDLRTENHYGKQEHQETKNKKPIAGGCHSGKSLLSLPRFVSLAVNRYCLETEINEGIIITANQIDGRDDQQQQQCQIRRMGKTAL